MNLITDYKTACEEAQYLADYVLHCGQRRAAFLIQRGADILVTQQNPKKRTVMQIFAPTPKARRIYRNNKSGHAGIYRNNSDTGWKTIIRRKGKRHYVGVFACLATAVAKRAKMLKELGYV